ncbi:hypothetical protein ACKI1J_14610 [Streptomyces scabiei]|uniref:hypothetical protein n=1 Tax=Streptomyces scabiei TaxID=1930 RepID=UPI0029B6890F|nr:hypothetical protein [Streptomyces scabiei]MDX3520672.1 hypothetical protein [Streptomyces scabiei]
MTVDTWVQAGLAIVGAAGGVVAARSARRTKRQERRDDFTTVTDRMEKEIKRLETRQGEQQEQLTGQGAAISWLVVDRRSLVGYIRGRGLEPPAPRPIPERARPYLEHLDM